MNTYDNGPELFCDDCKVDIKSTYGEYVDESNQDFILDSEEIEYAA